MLPRWCGPKQSRVDETEARRALLHSARVRLDDWLKPRHVLNVSIESAMVDKKP
jgi:hypothetical protein